MADDTDQTDPDPRERMEQALRAIRREGWKAGTVYAAVDGVAALLAVNLLVTVLDPSLVPAEFPLPPSVADRATALPGVTGSVSVPGPTLVGGVAGLVVAVGEFAWRVRQPLVDQFEAGNPEVAESLRTARDAVEGSTDTEMARRLYADVLERLQETSSVTLVDMRRVTVTVVVVVVLSAVSIQAAVFEVTITGGSSDPVTTTEDESVEFSGLQEGASVLGEAGAVQSGEENLSAQVESTRGDESVEEPDEFPEAGGPGAGAGSSGTVESQQAGFTRPERIENAELVREYNVRIRDQEES
jgi:hypothetical protein